MEKIDKLPFFPSERPQDMSKEDFDKSRKLYNQLIKAHKRLGYKHDLSGTVFSVMRQAKKYEKDGWSQRIPNQQAYVELYNDLLSQVNREGQ